MNPTDKPINLDAVPPDFDREDLVRQRDEARKIVNDTLNVIASRCSDLTLDGHLPVAVDSIINELGHAKRSRDSCKLDSDQANEYILKLGKLLGCADGDDTPEIRIQALIEQRNVHASRSEAVDRENERLTAEREHNANMADMWRSVADELNRALLVADDDGDYSHEAPNSIIPKALAAYASAKEHDGASGWRPIETAPKDGTRILICWLEIKDGDGHPITPTWEQRAAYWDVRYETVWNEQREDNDYRGGWTDYAAASFGYEEVQEYHPTHWQPLPPAPKTP